jgi:hypothetical protein
MRKKLWSYIFAMTLGLITNGYASCHQPMHFIIDTSTNPKLFLMSHHGAGANYSATDGTTTGFYWNTEAKYCVLGYTYIASPLVNEIEKIRLGTNTANYCNVDMGIDGFFNVTPYIIKMECFGQITNVMIDPNPKWDEDFQDPNTIAGTGGWVYKLKVISKANT